MSYIETVDYTLRGAVGGATPPEASDFVQLENRSLAAILFPAGWAAGLISFRFDIGDGVAEGHEVLSVDYTGKAGLFVHINKVGSLTLAPVNLLALFPDSAKGSDLIFTLVTVVSTAD